MISWMLSAIVTPPKTPQTGMVGVSMPIGKKPESLTRVAEPQRMHQMLIASVALVMVFGWHLQDV